MDFQASELWETNVHCLSSPVTVFCCGAQIQTVTFTGRWVCIEELTLWHKKGRQILKSTLDSLKVLLKNIFPEPHWEKFCSICLEWVSDTTVFIQWKGMLLQIHGFQTSHLPWQVMCDKCVQSLPAPQTLKFWWSPCSPWCKDRPLHPSRKQHFRKRGPKLT